MADDSPQELGAPARVVIAFAIVLIVAGVLWHGITLRTLQRLWHDLVEEPSGPMKFRFILQPSMAALVAIRDGYKDAQTGRSPYFWAVLRKSDERMGRLREGLNATARVILLALALDLIYQFRVLNTFYPNEALIIALLLAFVPYVLIRGLVTRIAQIR
jgi:hypothetical protein